MIQHKEENVMVQGKRGAGRSRWASGAEPRTLRKEGKGSSPGGGIERGEVRTCFSDSCFLMKRSKAVSAGRGVGRAFVDLGRFK